MKSALILFAAVLALLGGCTTPSLNALATPETTVTDPDLVGRRTSHRLVGGLDHDLQ